VVVLAHDLTPSEAASLNPQLVRGLVTETGGRTSHTAIVAGALEIPTVVGLGRHPQVEDGTTVVVDGHRGVLIIAPDQPTLQQYERSQVLERQQARSLEGLRNLPAVTRDGCRVKLFGNIEFPPEAQHCAEKGAEGIGLYRTEFLYLDRATPPTEEEQFTAYAAVVRAIGPGRPVTFRTLDLGADKLNHDPDRVKEPNPFLGLRSIRLSLREPELFKTQLRAILRASVLGDVRIMFPLVSTLREIRRCRMILADVMEDLEEENIPFQRNLPVGMMVEVPSAALLAEQFARHVDFFSIGTNDLIQYTLAVDRTNETVASLYSPSDPAVLRLVRRVVVAAEKNNVAVTVCGEMSGDPIYAPLLVGLGVRQFSLTPHNIPQVKRVIRSVTLTESRGIATHALRLDYAPDITKLLRNRFSSLVTESRDDHG
jgi:phosphoenolpyruvate-protein phosphotransferase (PTS system enzyme I)